MLKTNLMIEVLGKITKVITIVPQAPRIKGKFSSPINIKVETTVKSEQNEYGETEMKDMQSALKQATGFLVIQEHTWSGPN